MIQTFPKLNKQNIKVCTCNPSEIKSYQKPEYSSNVIDVGGISSGGKLELHIVHKDHYTGLQN